VIGGFAALHTRPLFSMRLAVDALLAVGGPQGNGRRIGGISGGTFEGDRLSGTVMPGGTDWQMLRGDGAVQLDARIVLKTDDDALIAMTYVGLRHGLPDVLERLNRGEPVDPGDYYFRIVPSFATSDPRYDWLNRVVAVATGQRSPKGPDYSVHEIL